MKCDELKDYDYDPDFPFKSRGRFYIADEVEAAIAELKAENERLRGESCKLTDGCLRLKQCRKEKANLADELRATKRVLWLARAERAKEMCKRLLIQGFDPKWEEVERKCLKKAEEYK